MHIHILGICGTFMGGIALLARAAGHTRDGLRCQCLSADEHPARGAGHRLIEGYDAAQAGLKPDVFVVGNAISRGNPLLEAILDQGLPYVSGPQWLAENVLRGAGCWP
jgi:UDP-N-acetylmuramate: L-alanyl-gamma-D-glutamyl-meso-diaminopimelate ligase